MNEHAFLSGIILAAGFSTRMGRPKQLLELGGRPLLQHVLDAAAGSRLDELVLVLGHAADDIRAAIRLPSGRALRVVLNEAYAAGQSTSLRLGIRSADARATAVAVLLGDQPGVTSALIDHVATMFLAGETPAARPVWRARDGVPVPGHPVFIARRIWPAVHDLRGDQGARDLFRRSSWLHEVAMEGDPPADIDDAIDYARARALATPRG